MPALESLFPRAVEHLGALALSAQKSAALPDELTGWLSASGIRLRRAHWETLRARLAEDPEWRGEVHLPGGWRLVRGKSGKWLLERLSGELDSVQNDPIF